MKTLEIRNNNGHKYALIFNGYYYSIFKNNIEIMSISNDRQDLVIKLWSRIIVKVD